MGTSYRVGARSDDLGILLCDHNAYSGSRGASRVPRTSTAQGKRSGGKREIEAPLIAPYSPRSDAKMDLRRQ
jgi:hypothetical protein